jgi:hypothetical protein
MRDAFKKITITITKITNPTTSRIEGDMRTNVIRVNKETITSGKVPTPGNFGEVGSNACQYGHR